MNDIRNALPSHLAQGWDKTIKPKNTMGKNEFMKLLVTQLRNQDPLKPMEHNEFIAQLAQFSSLEQLHNIGDGVQKLHGGLGEEAKLQALGMIGKKVEANGDLLELEKGKSLSVRHHLSQGTKPIYATIFDASGKLVRKIDLSGKSLESSRNVTWDGKDEEGKLLPSGKYTFRVLGLDKKGMAEEVGTDISGRVTGVSLVNDRPLLTIQTGSGDSKQVELTRVRRVLVDDQGQKQGHSLLKGNAPTTSVGSDAPVAAAGKAAPPSVAEVRPDPDASSHFADSRAWRRFPGTGGYRP